MDSTPLPLIFITSTDSTIPQGRNARVQARTKAFSHSLRPQHLPTDGFTRSQSGHPDLASSIKSPRRRLGRRKEAPEDEHQALLSARSRPRPPCLQLLTTSPCGVDPDAILSLARFHIARVAVVLVRYHPERLGDVLRWRHWTYASIAPISVGERTACVDSALRCLSAKLDDLLSAGPDDSSSPGVLLCYERGLTDLRHALVGDRVVRREDLLVTAQLLAIFEILRAPEEDAWTKHATGAVSMLMSSKPRHHVSRTSGWPILTEALLDYGKGSFANAPRRALADLVLAGHVNSTNEIMNIILQVAALIDSWWIASYSSCLNRATSFALLATAHDLRDQLRFLAISNKGPSATWKRPSDDYFDYLGFGLVCLVALDQLIIALRPAGPPPRLDIHEETHTICVQMLQGELAALENSGSLVKVLP